MRTLALSGCFALGLALGCATSLRAAEESSPPPVAGAASAGQARPRPVDAASALSELEGGNRRFVAGSPLPRDRHAEVQATREDQKPFAAVLSCIDSRVPPEIVFDQGIGDLFVARVAGNVENVDVLGSLEFAAAVKGVPLVVVMGHDGCGAVAGACKGVKLGNLTTLLAEIEPAVREVARQQPKADHASRRFQDEVAKANVKRTVRDLTSRSSVLAKLVAEGKLKIVGAMYELETGKVVFLD